MPRDIWVCLIVVMFVAQSRAAEPQVGPADGGGYVVPTEQTIRPAGQSVQFHGRPVDLVLSPDKKTVYVKSMDELIVLDASTWTMRQNLKYTAKLGASLHGIAVSDDGSHVYLTGTSALQIADISDGKATWGKRIVLHGYPNGIALLKNNRAAVCLSTANALAIVDLSAGKIERRINVSIAPYGVVVSADERTAYVTNWGGRRPTPTDKTAKSAGSDTVVDKRGVASSGTVGVVDLIAGRQTAEIEIGLHPADLKLSADGKTLYVANANSDTISVVDTAARKVTRTITVRPDASLPFGSASNALALSGDEKALFVANGGNNAIAVVHPKVEADPLAGFIPVGWYPGAIVCDGATLYIANVKGVGSRNSDNDHPGKWKAYDYLGSVTKVAIPSADVLAKYTAQVKKDALVPQALAAWEKSQSDQKPVAVPTHVGEPSVFQHIVYILKENRTYDQMLGDIGKGNSDPDLCIYPRKVTPNHHALAEQFALLDNYYCNGVASPEGHAWAMEGVAVDYLEKTYGGWERSYPFGGNDALAIASSGFIWDDALEHGRSFRNYGEMALTRISPAGSWADVERNYLTHGHKYAFDNVIAIDHLRQYSCPQSPGWNLHLTDQYRADVFLRELKSSEQSGRWPNLITLYLPQDHTLASRPDAPRPESMIADNDLAIGRVVDAISHSRFWPTTCVFIMEDDPQAGFDHVDGHRSLCLVASPYTKRGAVVSHFYNQTAALHTMELMLGIPPMNQFDASSPPMTDVFTSAPDLTPYTALPNEIPLDEMNAPRASLSQVGQKFADASLRQNFDEPDRVDDNTMNRILWYSAKGSAPYPAAYAGAHGKGLKALHLKLEDGAVDDDD